MNTAELKYCATLPHYKATNGSNTNDKKVPLMQRRLLHIKYASEQKIELLKKIKIIL